jgi:menaquinone-specific isochorismate synthase
VDEVSSSTLARAPGLAAEFVRATIDCPHPFALPSRLGGDASFAPQAGWSDSHEGGVRWLALGELDAIEAPAGCGPAVALQAIDRARERLKLLASLSPDPSLVRYVGGLAFDPRDRARDDWPEGIAARWVLPRILVREVGGRADVMVMGTPPAEARVLLAKLEKAAALPSRPPEPIAMRRLADPAARDRWTRAVRVVLEAIESQRVRKVVLSRDIVLEAGEAIDPWELLRLVDRRDPHGLRFCLRFSGEAAFVGATPERLVSQRGSAIACDCLAGTSVRGVTPQEESRNARALLASEKDGREHRIVLEEILEAIGPHVRDIDSPATPSILALAEVQHLWSPIRARLREGAGIGAVVASLHPTAAVGGSPRDRALDLVRDLEGRPRGWYAGLVGWIGTEASDFAVAIRSGIVRGNRLTAFGGAGIVRGSDPAAEWDETARKAASFIHLFAERA